MKPELTYQNWNDVVFEGRNKHYGAYLLRKIYDRNVLLSAAIALSVFMLALSVPRLLEYFKAEEVEAPKAAKTIRYTDLAPPPPIDKMAPPPPKLNVPPPVKAVIKFLPPKVTDQEVPEEEVMPTIEEIKANETGAETIEGDADVVFEGPPVEVTDTGEGAPAEVFTIVEQMPEFEGGDAALMQWLAKNIEYPRQALRTGIQGTVMVSFMIDETGQIKEVVVVRGIGMGCDEEAVRVISSMPGWKPGKQNGQAVRVRRILPIKFQISNS
ncbi:energy transducer TonB [Cesiribacter sp. SM1]|uniref:energy transducer TonB n=1 Tax=Cesiribacter sp. SM1 TaxID=2861196 RepID=UPI001CD212FE|nr:energy transducer TonB [Cesiribacter sp. SM1]